MVWYGRNSIEKECHWLVAASKMHSRWVNALNVQAPWGCLFATCCNQILRDIGTCLIFFASCFCSNKISTATSTAIRQWGFVKETITKNYGPFGNRLDDASWCLMSPGLWDYNGLYMCAFLRTMTTPHHSIAKKNLTWPWPCLVSIWNIAWLCLTDNNNCSLTNWATQCVLSGHGLSALWQQDVHILLIRSRSIVFYGDMCVFLFNVCVWGGVVCAHIIWWICMNMHKIWIQSSLFSDSTE